MGLAAFDTSVWPRFTALHEDLRDNPRAAIGRLMDDLGVAAEAAPDIWRDTIDALASDSHLIDLLTEDPLTNHLRRHGHEPDAWCEAEIMIGSGQGREAASLLGQRLFDTMTESVFGQAVRRRQVMFMRAMEALASQPDPQRLALIGFRHCARQFVDPWIGGPTRFDVTVIDALETGAFHGTGVRHRFVPSWRACAIEAGDRDLILVRGVVGDLNDAAAARFVAALAGGLAPGGRLIIADLALDGRDAAFCEGVLRLARRYRRGAALAALAPHLPGVTTTTTVDGGLASLTLTRAA